MPNIERYAKYEITESITSIGNISKAIDYNDPLAYKDWLSYFTDISVSNQTYQNTTIKKEDQSLGNGST